VDETKTKILKVLAAIPNGVLYSTTGTGSWAKTSARYGTLWTN
jgi:hypothetical protein